MFEVPQIVNYLKLVFPANVSLDLRSLESLREQIILQTQGEPVEVSENLEIPILMIVLDTIHHFSPEMVLKLETGERILIFDHQAVPVLREKEIVTNFCKQKPEKNDKEGTEELNLNLEEFWRKTKSESWTEKISEFLNKIQKALRPAAVTTLSGDVPALLFLLVQHQLYGLTGEIWYQENKPSRPLRITKFL